MFWMRIYRNTDPDSGPEGGRKGVSLLSNIVQSMECSSTVQSFASRSCCTVTVSLNNYPYL